MKLESSLDGVFDALANEHRRAIVDALSERPHAISELAAARGLSLPAIHRHIVILEEVGFVLRRKSGRTNFLALGRSPLLLVQEWISGFHAYWGSDGETLENYIDHLSRQPTLEGQE